MIFFIKGTRVNGREEETMIFLRVGKSIVGERVNIRQNSRSNIPIGGENTSHDKSRFSCV